MEMDANTQEHLGAINPEEDGDEAEDMDGDDNPREESREEDEETSPRRWHVMKSTWALCLGAGSTD